MNFPVCEGSGQQVTVVIENDWWVGETTVCQTCFRGGLKPTKGGKVPRHKNYSTVEPFMRPQGRQ